MRTGNQSKGIGFVSFSTTEETTKALNEMNGKWVLSKPIYVKLSSNDDKPVSSILPTTPTYPAAAPMPYPNIVPIFYAPTVMVPHPSNNFPLPIVRAPSASSSTTQTIRHPYSYNRVKSDDQ